MEIGLCSLKLGALARLHVPSHLAYGEHSTGVIPPHSGLVFEVEILCINDWAAIPTPSNLLRHLLVLPCAPGLESMESALSDSKDARTVHISAEAIALARQRADEDSAASNSIDPDSEAEAMATMLPTEVV